jgi:hypothetical protein
MQTQLREILYFLRNPSAFLTQKTSIPPGKGLFYALANKLGIYMIIMVALVVVSLLIKAGTGFYLLDLFTEEKIRSTDLRREYFMILVYAPMIEELLLRGYLGLTRLGVWHSVSFLFMLVFPVLLRFVPDNPPLYYLAPYLLCYFLLALAMSIVLGR